MKVQSPSRLFSEGLEAILVGVVWYHMIQSRHITGNPLNFFPLCLFHSSACDSSHAVTYMGLTGFNATYYPCPCVRIRLCNRRITGNTDHSLNRIQMRCLRVLRFHLRNTLKFLRSPLILKYLKCGCHVFIVNDDSIVTIFYNFNVLFHHIPFTVSDK